MSNETKVTKDASEVENYEPKRQLKQLKNSLSLIYSLFLTEFEAQEVTFSQVKEKLINSNKKLIEESKRFKNLDDCNGSGQNERHYQYKYATRVKQVLEKLTPDNVADSLNVLEKLLDQARMDNANARAYGTKLVQNAAYHLNLLLMF